MTDDLLDEVQRVAAALVESVRERADLDYSEASLAAVEELLAEAAEYLGDLQPGHADGLAEQFGCYLLEVARREFGGRYLWYEARNAPVLVTGEPHFRLALLTWDKTRGRIAGDPADNIPFFYQGFADRARRATPGDDALYV